MAKLQIKKSNETGKVPQPGDLDWGELAINYTDGKLFYKKHGTGTVELLNPDTNTVTRLRGTTSGTYTSGDLTLVAGTNITITQSGSDYTISSAGVVDNTKLPLAGGTLTGALSITDTTQSTSTGTGSLITAGGVGIAKNLYVGNTIYITRAIEMSTSNNGLYHVGNNMTFDSPANDTFRIVNGRGSAYPATLLFKSGYTGNTYGAVIGGGGEIRLETNRGNAFTSTAINTAIADQTGTNRIVIGGDTTQIYNNLTLENSGLLTAGTASLTNTTASTSTTTGALKVAGGVGIAGAVNIGDNVGIGIVSSSDKLHVEGTIRTSSGSNYSQFANNFLRSNASGTFYFDNYTVGQSFAWRTSASSALDTTAITLTSSGNFGIGTSSPVATVRLTVAKNDGIIQIQRATGTTYPFSFGIASDGRFNIYDVTASLERLSITQTGNVGIGTPSPGRKLTISRPSEATSEQLEFRNESGISTGNYDGIVWTQGSGGTTLAAIRINYNSSGSPDMAFNLRNDNNVIFLKNGGNVGVGTPTPAEKLDVAGNIKHTGLVMTAGTNIDQIYTHQQSIILTTAWQDTGVNAAELATGSYIVQVVAVSDYTVGGQQYDEYYTGVMSWFASNTNSAASDEIPLHRAGHAPNSGTIFLRVIRTLSADTDDLKLQIAGTTTNSAAYQYTFKFRRLI